MDQFKTIARYRDLPLAELAKSKLDSEGIYCFLANKNHVGANWLVSFALGEVKVQVKTEDAEVALKILNKDQSSELIEIEETFPALTQNDLCIKCSSSNIVLLNTTRKAGAFSLLLGLPFIFFRKRYKCIDCGHIMNQKSNNL
ncbi:MAG: DUF2007 domain-containing protein [Desulfobacterales bacterium]|nr:DUF2007 domain-containing protein [Desulfobacterales bacterium]MCP4158544.1 DUF2007 domain-containing protein [Deltaproteobacteria bacterium]